MDFIPAWGVAVIILLSVFTGKTAFAIFDSIGESSDVDLGEIIALIMLVAMSTSLGGLALKLVL